MQHNCNWFVHFVKAVHLHVDTLDLNVDWVTGEVVTPGVQYRATCLNWTVTVYHIWHQIKFALLHVNTFDGSRDLDRCKLQYTMVAAGDDHHKCKCSILTS